MTMCGRRKPRTINKAATCHITKILFNYILPDLQDAETRHSRSVFKGSHLPTALLAYGLELSGDC
jgi:hypothetical protein